jgi:hypothetical protein
MRAGSSSHTWRRRSTMAPDNTKVPVNRAQIVPVRRRLPSCGVDHILALYHALTRWLCRLIR